MHPVNSFLSIKSILKLDAWFLIIAGTLAGFADLLSYFKGLGVWGQYFYANPLTVGFFEAHALAIIIGLFFIRTHKTGDFKFNGCIALLTHYVLGTSNLIWFDGFSMVGAETMGIIATIIHFVFVSLYIIIWFKPFIFKTNERI